MKAAKFQLTRKTLPNFLKESANGGINQKRSNLTGERTMEKKQIAQLVSKVLEGDEKAFEQLYNITNQKAYFVAKKITKDDEAALDILQDSYIKALEKLSTLSDPESFVSWFNQIVANTSKNYLCKNKPILFNNEEDESSMTEMQVESDSDYIPEESLDTDETRKAIMDIIDSLPEDRRLCVLMHYFDDMPVSEIAETLDVSEGTVKSHLYHSRKKIKETIEELRKKGITVLGASAIPFFKWLIKRIGFSQVIAKETAASLLGIIVDSSVVLGGAAVIGGATVAVETGIVSGIISKIVAIGAVPKIIAAVTGTAVLVTGVTVGTKVAVDKRRENENTTVESTRAVAEENKTHYELTTYNFEVTTSNGEAIEVIIPNESTITQNALSTAENTTSGRTTVESSANQSVTVTQRPSSTQKTTKATTLVTTSVASTTVKPTTSVTQTESTTRKTTTTTTKVTTTAKQTTTQTTTNPVTTTEKPTTTTTTAVETTTEKTDFTYTSSGSTATITGYTGSSSSIEIPSTIDGLTVTAIGRNAFADRDITSVRIPLSVSTISSGAFQNCVDLRTVNLPSGLSSIGNVAFKNCSSLTSINISSGSIGAGAFQGCSSLSNVSISSSVASIGTNAFDTGSENLVISCPSGSAAHAYAEENGITVNLT